MLACSLDDVITQHLFVARSTTINTIRKDPIAPLNFPRKKYCVFAGHNECTTMLRMHSTQTNIHTLGNIHSNFGVSAVFRFVCDSVCENRYHQRRSLGHLLSAVALFASSRNSSSNNNSSQRVTRTHKLLVQKSPQQYLRFIGARCGFCACSALLSTVI